MNLEHLQEEEKLAQMMQSPLSSCKAQFSYDQWRKYKEEFWSSVKRYLSDKTPKSLVNIGCGYDKHFREFEQQGHIFIN